MQRQPSQRDRRTSSRRGCACRRRERDDAAGWSLETCCSWAAAAYGGGSCCRAPAGQMQDNVQDRCKACTGNECVISASSSARTAFQLAPRAHLMPTKWHPNGAQPLIGYDRLLLDNTLMSKENGSSRVAGGKLGVTPEGRRGKNSWARERPMWGSSRGHPAPTRASAGARRLRAMRHPRRPDISSWPPIPTWCW